VKEYTFREATSLLDFLERSMDKIIGQHINGFYSDVPVEPFGMVSTSSALFLNWIITALSCCTSGTVT